MAAEFHSAGADRNEQEVNMFKPPIVRSAVSLNRSLFARTYDIAAAALKDNRNISRYRKALEKSQDSLHVPRVSSVVSHPDKALASAGNKCLLLRPGILPSAPETWGQTLSDGVKQDDLSVIPYKLELGYEHWNYHDILQSLLPEQYADDLPSSFNTAGHVAHLNLRDHHLPYKHLIGEVIADKNSHIKTVINKVENVGTASEFRTFNYEVLFGDDDLMVEVSEANCTFRFDYSKVYWNSRLEQEHKRLVSLFSPGDVVCDVMAGIGPFAVPAGKKGIFVWANDMNPESYRYMKEAIAVNKVGKYVRPFNEDGRTFIKRAVDLVLDAAARGDGVDLPLPKQRRSERDAAAASAASRPKPEPERRRVPPTIAHFVMNLPASATTFLPSFRGLYSGHEALFHQPDSPGGGGQRRLLLPLVHVHCFATKSDDEAPRLEICARVSSGLGLGEGGGMRLGHFDNDGEVSVHNVRDVAPGKTMYCASFRLPAAVAFAPRETAAG